MEKNLFGLKQALIDEIISIAKANEVEKVVLFGSRARGDYRQRSDIDIAFWGGKAAGFITDIHEDANTLLIFDVVDMLRPVQKELAKTINKEGVLIYEKV